VKSNTINILRKINNVRHLLLDNSFKTRTGQVLVWSNMLWNNHVVETWNSAGLVNGH